MKKRLLLAAAVLLGCGSLMAQPVSVSQPRLLLQATTQGLMAPTWSPDGSKIAVTGDSYTGIWVANADGSGLTQVSEASGAGYKMSWIDASRIQSTPYTMVNNRRMTRIENVNVTTGEKAVVAAAERNFKRSRVNRANDVLAIMVDDALNATKRIASLSEYAGKMVLNPALSPDGSKIAFQVVSKGLFVCDADGSNVVFLGKGAHASWMPDNRHVMASRPVDNGDVITASDIYCFDIAGGTPMNITADSNVIPVTLAVSPDGSQVAFDNDRDGCIYVIDLTY